MGVFELPKEGEALKESPPVDLDGELSLPEVPRLGEAAPHIGDAMPGKDDLLAGLPEAPEINVDELASKVPDALGLPEAPQLPGEIAQPDL